MPFIDLPLALSATKQDAGVDDAMVQACLDGATQSAIDYLNRQVFETEADMDAAVAAGTAGDFPMVVNAAVKSAILRLTAELYDNREDSAVGTLTEMPFNARTLLRPHSIPPGL